MNANQRELSTISFPIISDSSNLNKAVRRNLDRFPPDFMFQLTQPEARDLRFQVGISSSGYGGRRYMPYAFTEQG
jgi:ORF6N domain